MYLIDTNIFLELLLEQKKAEDVRKFFLRVPPSKMCISEFTFYSIGVILIKLKRFELFLKWIKEIVDAGIHIIRLNPEDMTILIKNAEKFNLDFDDAYQYTITEKYDLQLVSFDKDFDRTKIKRKTPSEVTT